MYNSEGLAPNQPVSLVFQWALHYGYQELTNYIWDKVTPEQREYVGILQWRRICKQSKNRPTFKVREWTVNGKRKAYSLAFAVPVHGAVSAQPDEDAADDVAGSISTRHSSLV